MKTDDMRDDERPLDCDVVTALVPTYVDGEVAGSVASSVRQHLIACGPCRLAVQDESALRQWFVPTDEIPVPQGFAARVVSAAMAGRDASANDAPVPSVRSDARPRASREGFTLVPPAPGPALAGSTVATHDDRTRSFAMVMTAVAAAVIIAVTLVIAAQSRLGVNTPDLDASEPLDIRLETLDAQNEALESAAGEGTDATEESDR